MLGNLIQYSHNNWRKALVAMAALAGLSACVQDFDMHIPRYADKEALTVSENTLKTVNRAFYGDLMMGNWFYKGAKVANGAVNAYIQIPDRLDMEEDIQEQYLRMVICPKKDKIDMWNQLQHIHLAVHIYTNNQRNSVSAYCPNPWRNKA